MSTVINCKAIADNWIDETKYRVRQFAALTGRTPQLVTIVASGNSATQRYLRNKMRVCERCGIDHREIELHYPILSQREKFIVELKQFLNKLSEFGSVDGIMIQLPMFRCLDSHEFIQHISPAKDVDCLTAHNMGKLALGDNSFMPATVAGIMRLFQEEAYDLQGKTAVIRGRSNIVGKPLALAMINAGATVISENSHSSFMLMNDTDDVDIWIDATGKAACDNTRYVCDYYIDVTTRIGADGKLHGSLDWNQEGEAISEPLAGEDEWLYNMSCDYYTSVPGGVGLLTCAALASNLMDLAEKRTFDA